MRVLLVTEAFPPAPIVGSFRAYKVARAFRDAGADVTVFTMRGGDEAESESGEFEPGIRWQRIIPWPGPRQAYLRARSLIRRNGSGSGNVARSTATSSAGVAGSAGVAASRGSGRLRSIVTGLMALPDDRQGLVPAVRRAAAPMRGQVDLVYATAPCFSALLAGRAAAKELDCPWFAELRDPWIGNAGRARLAATPVVGRLDRWIERRCLTDAAGIVLVTPRAADAYRVRYSNRDVLAVLNGIDEVAALPRPRTPGPVRVVYAGSVYPPRNPAPLVQSLAEAWSEILAPGEITFVGADGWKEAPGLEEAVAALPAHVRAQRLPWLPQSAARQLVNSADLLLLPAQQWRLQIPNKLYDYLGSRVPVLGIVEYGSDTEHMLQESGEHYLVYPNADEVMIRSAARAGIIAAIEGRRTGDEERLQNWTTRRQMESLMDHVRRITGHAAAGEAVLSGTRS